MTALRELLPMAHDDNNVMWNMIDYTSEKKLDFISVQKALKQNSLLLGVGHWFCKVRGGG